MQSARRFLMCRPEFFERLTPSNPWPRSRVDRAVAVAQWQSLRETLTRCGAKTDVMRGAAGVDQIPDLAFTAKAALVRGNNAYLACSSGDCGRERQHKYFHQWFEKNGYQVFTDDHEQFTFEGNIARYSNACSQKHLLNRWVNRVKLTIRGPSLF